MVLEVQERFVRARILAVARRVTTPERLTETISEALGPVWAFVGSRPELRPGRHVVMYIDDEMHVECGVEVERPFASTPTGPVVCSQTLAGRVLAIAFRGPYENLPQVHQRIRGYAMDREIKLARPCWEIYGGPESDPLDPTTEIYYPIALR
ncbi:MAG: hypothetical protein SFX72_16750 [Isosphaeraceae bacterium]|nr:hypothetical protein [Isosphaeraceae bacterium]